MELWIDAQLSPAVAAWINRRFKEIKASSVKSLGLRDASDLDIFQAAKKANSIILTKDVDFVLLINRFGSPPKILLLSFGNSRNTKVKEILEKSLMKAIDLLNSGESIVEIKE